MPVDLYGAQKRRDPLALRSAKEWIASAFQREVTIAASRSLFRCVGYARRSLRGLLSLLRSDSIVLCPVIGRTIWPVDLIARTGPVHSTLAAKELMNKPQYFIYLHGLFQERARPEMRGGIQHGAPKGPGHGNHW